MPRYLITTGSSKTGSATIKALKNLGVSPSDIVAGSRDPSRSEAQLKALGAGHVVQFDHENEESIAKALVGIERVLVSVGSTLRIAPVYARVEKIASQAGSSVKAIVGIGGILFGDGEVTADFELAQKTILDSKLDSVVVAPNWFFENWFEPALTSQIQAGTVYGSSADGKVAYIAAQDIGNVVAAVLTDPHKYNNQRLIITGPAAFTEGEIADILAKEGLGKPEGAAYVNVPEDAYRGALAGSGIPAPWIDYLYELEVAKAANAAAEVTTTVKDVTGKEPVSLQTWAKNYAKGLSAAH